MTTQSWGDGAIRRFPVQLLFHRKQMLAFAQHLRTQRPAVSCLCLRWQMAHIRGLQIPLLLLQQVRRHFMWRRQRIVLVVAGCPVIQGVVFWQLTVHRLHDLRVVHLCLVIGRSRFSWDAWPGSALASLDLVRRSHKTTNYQFRDNLPLTKA